MTIGSNFMEIIIRFLVPSFGRKAFWVDIKINDIVLLQSNLTHLPRHEYVPGIGMGVAKCPYDPADNSTALWVEKGNPGSLPALYSGTNAEFTKADTVIFRTDLHNLTTGRREFSFKRTLKYDSKWLDSKLLIYQLS